MLSPPFLRMQSFRPTQLPRDFLSVPTILVFGELDFRAPAGRSKTQRAWKGSREERLGQWIGEAQIYKEVVCKDFGELNADADPNRGVVPTVHSCSPYPVGSRRRRRRATHTNRVSRRMAQDTGVNSRDTEILGDKDVEQEPKRGHRPQLPGTGTRR
jgi:hypothetical protein